MSLNESYPQHVVTAVIVAHDGAAWLPQVAAALDGQTRPVQRVVAVDTGSRDRSGAVLAERFGRGAVFGMDRSTGYGAAVARALTHRAANAPVPEPPGGSGQRLEWIWLLHDDCEPAPDALEQLLRGAAETSGAAVLGPKVRDWSNRDVILEAGITVDTAGRRVTGIEPREVDQGQHDGDRDALAVSSAGMLVRRDLYEQVGGFDRGMGLFMEDIDFCWRVHSAGYRVRVITDAVVYHVQAASRRRRAVSVGRRSRMLDRRNGLLTLLGNLPLMHALTSIAGNLALSSLRISFFLLAKRLAAAADEAAALTAVLGHPLRLVTMRGLRARGRRAAYNRIRADLPPGRSVRRLVEFAASTVMRSAQSDPAGAHHASADPTEDDSLLTDEQGLARRILTSPSVLTFTALVALTLFAARSLIGQGPLGGGSLVPAWGGASDLWRAYLQAFHPVGVGSAASVPPYVALLAVLASLAGAKPWLAIDLILIGCVPLSAMTAMFAARRVTRSPLVRAWVCVTYALLPVATGVIAAGRFGMAVCYVLLPLIAVAGGRMLARTGRQAARAAWAAALLVAIGSAFVPLLWVLAVIGCCLAAIAARRAAALRNCAIVALTAPLVLLPWSLSLLAHPGALLLEAGLPQPGTPSGGLLPRALLLLSPGGPGLPPYWVTGGLIAVAVVALFASQRRELILAGWGVALSGLAAAVAVSHLSLTPPDGPPVIAWAGLPLALAGLGLLLAAAAGADSLLRSRARRAGARGLAGGRAAWVTVLAVVACSAPALAAAQWVRTGVTGPVHRVAGQLVPELVAVTDGQSRQVRTLVLSLAHGHVSYLLLRGPSPSLADPGLAQSGAAKAALDRAVSALVTPAGGAAANQPKLLAAFDIGYVLVQAPVDPGLASQLNDVTGLRLYSSTASYDLWQLTAPPARVSVVEPNGTVVVIPSGPVGVTGVNAPSSGGTLVLAEPAGGWSATLNGRPLAQTASPVAGWGQAFRLPPGGGTLTIGYPGFGHDLVLGWQLLAFLVLIGLALPGIRVADADVAAAVTVAEPPAEDFPDETADETADELADEPGEAVGEPERLTRAGPRRAARSGHGGGHRVGARLGALTSAVPRPRRDEEAAPAGLVRASASWPGPVEHVEDVPDGYGADIGEPDARSRHDDGYAPAPTRARSEPGTGSRDQDSIGREQPGGYPYEEDRRPAGYERRGGSAAGRGFDDQGRERWDSDDVDRDRMDRDRPDRDRPDRDRSDRDRSDRDRADRDRADRDRADRQRSWRGRTGERSPGRPGRHGEPWAGSDGAGWPGLPDAEPAQAATAGRPVPGRRNVWRPGGGRPAVRPGGGGQPGQRWGSTAAADGGRAWQHVDEEDEGDSW